MPSRAMEPELEASELIQLHSGEPFQQILQNLKCGATPTLSIAWLAMRAGKGLQV